MDDEADEENEMEEFEMPNYYIEKVVASGKGKKDAMIEFTEGLNIIHGLSDTGKTCILKCIDFIFGSSSLPFDESTGYNTVRLAVVTPNGIVNFERKIGENKITVSSTDENIESGKYNAKNGDPIISSVWLRLIGIEDEHQIIKNENYKTKKLTWRTFVHMFLIKEEDITQEASILMPKLPQENTAFLSSLLFLMTDKDFSEFDEREEKKIKEARKKAVERYINNELTVFAERKVELTETLSSFESVNIDYMVEQIVNALSETEEHISREVERSRHLLGEILSARERLAECDMLRSRYQSLRSQYTADIKRLGFIVDGETKMDLVPHVEKCPFCDGEMPEHDHVSYLETSQAELARIMSQYDGLTEAEQDVTCERTEIEKELSTLIESKSNIEALINDELKPRAHEFTQMLISYRAIVRLRNEMDIIERFANERTAELRDMQNDDESELKYKPKEYFGGEFLEKVDNYLVEILTECKYEGLLTAQFLLETFDVVINGKRKATTRGKGFRAFLNTVLALVIRKYLAENGIYSPGLLIVDSPLVPLKQGVDDKAPESMRTALFNYLLKNQDGGQVIIIENDIPGLNYEAQGATVHHFTKGKSEGRYGFLYDVY